MLLLSIETTTVPTSVETVSPLALVMFPPIVPVKLDPSVRLSVSCESLPTRIVPSRVWLVALSVAVFVSPFQPSAQTESRIFSESLLIIFTLSRLITAVVFVTWKTWPFLLVSVPPFIVNTDVPLSASPDIDW